MIVKAAARGRSFKSLAAYLTGTREGQHRALWSSLENVAGTTPQTAARIMAATAKQADELKELAGAKATGRKATTGEVYHAVMSWPESVTPEAADQLEAARAMLKAAGLDRAQAVIVAHDDNGKSHLHIMANLVDAENGLRIKVGNDWRKMDAWATEYAEARGWLHLTPKRAERVEKQKRAKDQGTTAERVEPAEKIGRRDFQKIERAASNDWQRRKAERDAAFARQSAERGELRAAHSAEWKTAKAEAAQHKAAYKAAFRAAYARHKAADKAANRPAWGALFKRQESDRRALEYGVTNARAQALAAQEQARAAVRAVARADRRKASTLGRLAQRFGIANTPEQARTAQRQAAERMERAAAELARVELAKANLSRRQEDERKALGAQLSQLTFAKAQLDVSNMPRADFAAIIERQNVERAEQIERQNAERAALGMKPYEPRKAGAAPMSPLEQMKANEEQAKANFARASERRQNKTIETPAPVKHGAPSLTMGGRHSGNHPAAPDRAKAEQQAEAAKLADRSNVAFTPTQLRRERPTDQPLTFTRDGQQVGKAPEPEKAKRSAASRFAPSNDRTSFSGAELAKASARFAPKDQATLDRAEEAAKSRKASEQARDKSRDRDDFER